MNRQRPPRRIAIAAATALLLTTWLSTGAANANVAYPPGCRDHAWSASTDISFQWRNNCWLGQDGNRFTDWAAFVQGVQMILRDRNWYPPSYAIDGDFGPATQLATENFQNWQGLASDGIVGPNTWAELRNHVYWWVNDCVGDTCWAVYNTAALTYEFHRILGNDSHGHYGLWTYNFARTTTQFGRVPPI